MKMRNFLVKNYRDGSHLSIVFGKSQRFYTGICDYTKFEALHKYLGPAVHSVVYKDFLTNSGSILTP